MTPACTAPLVVALLLASVCTASAECALALWQERPTSSKQFALNDYTSGMFTKQRDGEAVGELNAMWENYMLEGRKIAVSIKGSTITTSEGVPNDSIPAVPRPEIASLSGRAISVMKLGEGIWGNGGWVIRGGLLGLAREVDSTVELYGKAVERQHPYFPFPFHRDPPRDTRYEFFLLHRKRDSPVARIVRRWRFDHAEIDAKQSRPTEGVRATLRYDPGTQTATVTIMGLKRPEGNVNLTTVLP